MKNKDATQSGGKKKGSVGGSGATLTQGESKEAGKKRFQGEREEKKRSWGGETFYRGQRTRDTWPRTRPGEKVGEERKGSQGKGRKEVWKKRRATAVREGVGTGQQGTLV